MPKPLITLTLNVNGVEVEIDAIDISLDTERLEFCLVAPDTQQEYDRLVDLFNDDLSIIRWTEAAAKRYDDVRLVAVDTMNVYWNSDMFPIVHVAPVK